MSVRDLVVTAIIVALLPICFAYPWKGVLTWSWLGYMNPHRLTWGFARTTQFALFVAIATLLGLAFTKEKKRLPATIEVVLLFMLWGLFLVSTIFARQQADAWEQFDKISKIFLITIVTMVLFQDAKKLRTLVYVIALSLGYYGLKGGVWSIMTGGGNQVMGPEGTFIGGNTEIGLALNMILPLLLYLAVDEPRIWLRQLLRVTFCFSIVAILFTYSRGAVLGLAAVLPLIFLKSRARLFVPLLALVVAFFGQSALESVMPQEWLERMGTVKTYEQDLSARMRLNSWKVGYALGMDYPFIGAGFRPFTPEVYHHYTPEETINDWQDAHSIYLQVLAEHGVTGFVLYMLLILSTLVTLRRVMRAARRDPSKESLGRMAHALEVSMVGFLVSGVFLSMSYFDLFFHLIAIAVMLKVLVRLPAPELAAAPATAASLPRQEPIPTRPLVRF